MYIKELALQRGSIAAAVLLQIKNELWQFTPPPTAVDLQLQSSPANIHNDVTGQFWPSLYNNMQVFQLSASDHFCKEFQQVVRTRTGT